MSEEEEQEERKCEEEREREESEFIISSRLVESYFTFALVPILIVPDSEMRSVCE